MGSSNSPMAAKRHEVVREQVAAHFTQGLLPSEIATKLGVDVEVVRQQISEIQIARRKSVVELQANPEKWVCSHLAVLDRLRRAAINEAYSNLEDGKVHGARKMAKLAANCVVEATKFETPGPSVSPGVSLPYHMS